MAGPLRARMECPEPIVEGGSVRLAAPRAHGVPPQLRSAVWPFRGRSARAWSAPAGGPCRRARRGPLRARMECPRRRLAVDRSTGP